MHCSFQDPSTQLQEQQPLHHFMEVLLKFPSNDPLFTLERHMITFMYVKSKLQKSKWSEGSFKNSGIFFVKVYSISGISISGIVEILQLAVLHVMMHLYSIMVISHCYNKYIGVWLPVNVELAYLFPGEAQWTSDFYWARA